MTINMAVFEELFPHLRAPQTPMSENIGRTVRYVIPTDSEAREEFIRTHGTLCVTETFLIVGVQKDYKGKLCYRGAFPEDRVGRCIDPALVEWVQNS